MTRESRHRPAGPREDGTRDGKHRLGDGGQPSAPASRTPLNELARRAIRERIIDGSYAQGTRMVEREIAQDLRMSRVPVREALRALVEEGLLDLLPHSVRVRRLERADVEHLYDVWEPLAIQASRVAASPRETPTPQGRSPSCTSARAGNSHCGP